MNVRVSAGIIRNGGRILAARRASGPQEGLWELPGGKIEDGESPLAALQCELREELGCELGVAWPYDTVEYDYPDFHLSMECLVCNLAEGAEPSPAERPRKIREVHPTRTTEHRVVYSDIDFNRHVNTMRYIEMMLDMLPVELLTLDAPMRLDIHFLHECRFGQTLRIGCEERERAALFEISADDGVAAVRAGVEWY